jgi:Domain of unknown function (DUF3291)
VNPYQLAQLNIAQLKAPLESPLLADFVANLDRINAQAEAAPGYVWRLQDEAGDATAIRPLGDDTLINVSVWQDLESLQAFVYRSGHVEIMKRRKEWFDAMADVFVVLWWVPAGHRPTALEAVERLDRLRRDGPSPQAFGFKSAFGPPQS